MRHKLLKSVRQKSIGKIHYMRKIVMMVEIY